jgi:tRNA pseudouridine55 synthase
MLRNGWLIIDKPIGISSAKVVAIAKKALKLNKAGHTGTLDPMASGILPIACEEATKLTNYLLNSNKEYEFTIKFGAETNTCDLEGTITETTNFIPSQQEIQDIIPLFTGLIQQVPPIYSALKINGRRAYELARQGQEVEMQPRNVKIYQLELISYINNEATLKVEASKGTYVRSLARDIARKLHSLGHISSLRRIKAGKFSLKHAISLDNLNELVHNRANLTLLPMEEALDDIPALLVNTNQTTAIRFGQLVQVDSQVQDCECVQAICSKQLIAIGAVKEGYFKPARVFNY